MKTREIFSHVKDALAEKNIRAALVDVHRLADLEKDIAEQRERGSFDPQFFEKELSRLSFRPPREMENAKSMFLVAYPQPIVRVPFHHGGETILAAIPPHYDFTVESTPLEIINSVIGPKGYSARQFPALPPLKLLAVRCGLAEYGRNNIAYTKEFGSFHRLVLYYSDLPAEDDQWGPVKLMERCGNCRTCAAACPTKAIDPERFVLRAERCVTLFNESPADFPSWFDPSFVRALIGCLSCQEKCPANARVKGNVVTAEEFDSEETELLLGRPGLEALPEKTRGKLAALLSLQWYLPSVCRNLELLLRSQD